MKRIFICSPWRGDTERNRKVALALCRMAAMAGHNPIAPHLFYPQFLNDDLSYERALGIECARAELLLCEEVWRSDGETTAGMSEELLTANNADIPVEIMVLTEDEIDAEGN